MTDYRVLVTGSRDWPASKEHRVFQELEKIKQDNPGKRLVVVHGACPWGADLMASAWARSYAAAGMNVTEDPYAARWLKHGKKAGPLRNQEMVDAGADLYLAFIMPCSKKDCPNKEPHGSHGATDCVIRAVKARIPGRVFTHD